MFLGGNSMTTITHRWPGRFALIVILSSLATTTAYRISAFTQDQEETKTDEKKDTKKEETLPLKPEGKIEFTTDEGSWLSLDVAPDGKTIVFELLGDIYSLPVAGGEARVIARGMSFDSQPKYSPDGKRIAFLSDRTGSENLWLMDPDGQNPKAVTKGSKTNFASPSWMPDGNYIIASKATRGAGANSLWIYHKDGGSGIELIKSQTASGPPAPGGPPPK